MKKYTIIYLLLLTAVSVQADDVVRYNRDNFVSDSSLVTKDDAPYKTYDRSYDASAPSKAVQDAAADRNWSFDVKTRTHQEKFGHPPHATPATEKNVVRRNTNYPMQDTVQQPRQPRLNERWSIKE